MTKSRDGGLSAPCAAWGSMKWDRRLWIQAVSCWVRLSFGGPHHVPAGSDHYRRMAIRRSLLVAGATDAQIDRLVFA